MNIVFVLKPWITSLFVSVCLKLDYYFQYHNILNFFNSVQFNNIFYILFHFFTPIQNFDGPHPLVRTSCTTSVTHLKSRKMNKKLPTMVWSKNRNTWELCSSLVLRLWYLLSNNINWNSIQVLPLNISLCSFFCFVPCGISCRWIIAYSDLLHGSMTVKNTIIKMYVLSECYTKLNGHQSNVFVCNVFNNEDKCVVEIFNIFDLFSIYFLQVERWRCFVELLNLHIYIILFLLLNFLQLSLKPCLLLLSVGWLHITFADKWVVRKETRKRLARSPHVT